jgi:hypothetical protein
MIRGDSLTRRGAGRLTAGGIEAIGAARASLILAIASNARAGPAGPICSTKKHVFASDNFASEN